MLLKVIIVFIPLSELSQPFSQRYLWCKPEVTFKGSGIGIGRWHITGLHGNELLMGLEIKVLRENACTDELLLENRDKVEEILWLSATDIVYRIWRYGQSVFVT